MADRDAPETAREKRAARLAEELRANLARRKGQARARRDGAPDLRPEGMPAADAPEDERRRD